MQEILYAHPLRIGIVLLATSLIAAVFPALLATKDLPIILRLQLRPFYVVFVSLLAYLTLSGTFFVLWTGIIASSLADFGIEQSDLDRAQSAAGSYFYPFTASLFLAVVVFFYLRQKKVGRFGTFRRDPTRPLLLDLFRHFTFMAAALLVGSYALLIIVRLPLLNKQHHASEVAALVHAQRITLGEVLGDALPPMPDLNDASATVAGIDANHNGIRDDVELAIFRLHPDEARIRAAELQYARALQDELVRVFDSQTLAAASQEASRAYYCLSDAVSKPPYGNWEEHDARVETLKKETDQIVLNTPLRAERREAVFKRFMVSHGDMGGSHCDVDLTVLPN